MENTMELSFTLGDNIRTYRKQKGLQQKELAAKAGISVNYLSLIETGKRYPSLSTISKIGDLLGVSPADLLNNDFLLKELRALAQQYDKEKIIAGMEKLLSISDK